MCVSKHTVVGLGEVLWDLLPGGRQLGGAPTNFAYITSVLGDIGIVASRLGKDDLGNEASQALKRLDLPTAQIQLDREHPTGTVKVDVDAAGQPRLEITESVAWDYLEWTPEWRALAGQADAVCFGSLAQRSPRSRETIRQFLRAARQGATRVFDVNLRQTFFSADVLAESMKLTDVVKVNDDELPRVLSLLGIAYDGELASAQRLRSTYALKLVCVTRGARGSLLVNKDAIHEHSGFSVRVADTVGAGDAFTAGLLHHYLRGASPATMNDAANRVGSWVASQVGGTPTPNAEQLRHVLASSS